MSDLKNLLRTLHIVKSRRAWEKRVHGKTKQWRMLTREYHQVLHEISKATE